MSQNVKMQRVSEYQWGTPSETGRRIWTRGDSRRNEQSGALTGMTMYDCDVDLINRIYIYKHTYHNIPVSSREQSAGASPPLTSWVHWPASRESVAPWGCRAGTLKTRSLLMKTNFFCKGLFCMWSCELFITLWVPKLGRQYSTAWMTTGLFSLPSLYNRTGIREGTCRHFI